MKMFFVLTSINWASAIFLKILEMVSGVVPMRFESWALEMGVDVNARNTHDGDTFLHRGAMYYYQDLDDDTIY